MIKSLNGKMMWVNEQWVDSGLVYSNAHGDYWIGWGDVVASTIMIGLLIGGLIWLTVVLASKS